MNCFDGSKRKNGSVPTPDYKALSKLTNFNKAELQQIFSKFEVVADQQDGKLSKSTFLSLPELLCSPVASMVFDKELVEKGKDAMDFTEFCVIMDLFSKSAAADDKIKYLFELIRTTEANFITKEEYLVFYKEISSARHMSSKTVEEMVNQAWPLISVDDKLDRKRFAAHLSLFELHSIMTIDFT